MECRDPWQIEAARGRAIGIRLKLSTNPATQRSKRDAFTKSTWLEKELKKDINEWVQGHKDQRLGSPKKDLCSENLIHPIARTALQEMAFLN
jgi:hypothetical protein